jgi:glycosyltransferase involved in cell wall biosynthesis
VVAQGCTDESVAVAQRFREADQRVRIVEVPLNLGAAFARNWGILHARGEWYAFLDADDAYEAGAIEALLQAGERAKGSEFGVQGSGREEGERRKAEGENKDCGLLSAECGLNGTDSKSEIRNPQLAMPVVVHGRSRAWDPEMKRALYEEPWRAEVTAGRLKEQCCFVPGCMLAHEATFWQKELWWAECWQRIEDYEWQAAALGRVQFVFLDKVVLRKRETTESRAKWPAQSAWSRELRRLIQARLRR